MEVQSKSQDDETEMGRPVAVGCSLFANSLVLSDPSSILLKVFLFLT
jgi:hypothetical protein